VGFLDILLFHETKIPTVDMKVQVSFNFSKSKIQKKKKSPSSMRNGRFYTSNYRCKLQKMGLLYTHFFQNARKFLITPKKEKKRKKKLRNWKRGASPQSVKLRAVAQAPFFYTCFPLFLPATPTFFHMWSTPPHWLQLMPALPRRLLKFSNIHNFLSVAYKMMKFVPM
jgi:hypothetical protein